MLRRPATKRHPKTNRTVDPEAIMPEEKREIEYDKLNVLGKAVYLTGAVSRLAASAIDRAVHRAVDVAVDTERAFREGLDDTVEDAKIIAERRRDETDTDL